jgi:biofilm PGA synthesis N-glycosyltransferase PgaC
MISIIITAFKEPRTIAKAIESFINQKIKEDYELIISAPDEETLNVAKDYSKKNKKVKLFKDPGKGKSYAINLLLNKLKGRIIILTDGDVYVSENSVNEILKEFEDEKIGCVSGKPFPQESKETKYGFWAHFLMDSAHRLRKQLKKNQKFLECSGYLWAFRNKVIDNFPIDVAEDTVVPGIFWKKGYKIGYSENALVYVKNTNNTKDWIKQKTRTHKSHGKLDNYVKNTPRIKSFKTEAKGIFWIMKYPSNLKEISWTIQLVFLRLYTWIKYFLDTKVFEKTYEDGWERVESTK